MILLWEKEAHEEQIDFFFTSSVKFLIKKSKTEQNLSPMTVYVNSKYVLKSN